ncbi:TraY domain-containing protein [Vibrio sp. 10N.261.46.A3]|uniref:TraY domain-containing protein n=1 Tax=Vibrio sp. 10N.261.46.A3 TaxID=3229658 RepID=UPI00354F14E7
MENKQKYEAVNVTVLIPAEYNRALAESAEAAGRTKKAEAEIRMLASLNFHPHVMTEAIIVDKEGNRREF